MFQPFATRFVAALAVTLAAAALSTPAWAQHGGHHGGGGHGFGHHYDYGHGFFGHYGYGSGYGHHYSPFYLGLYYGPGYGYYGDYYVGSYGYAPGVYRSYDSPPVYANPAVPQTTGGRGSDLQRWAEAAFQTHHYEEAIRYADRAAAEAPSDGRVFLFLSQALFAVGDYRRAAGAARQGISLLDPRDWGVVVQSFRRYYHDADYVEQVRRLERFADENPGSADARFLMGYHYGFLGYPQEARRELTRALELESRDEMAQRLVELFSGEAPRLRPGPSGSRPGTLAPAGPVGTSEPPRSVDASVAYPPPQEFEKPKSLGGSSATGNHRHD